MHFLSATSMFAVLIYCFIGIYVFRQNPKLNIHKIFLCLSISYAIWSFGYAFVYLLTDKDAISFWNKFAAIGWCSFSALSLYLTLLITENKLTTRKYFSLIVFMPGLIFYYMAVFLFGPTIKTPDLISKIFYIGDFIYNFSYLLASIILLMIWGMKSTSIRIKRQSRILVVSSFVPFILNLITQTILPALHIAHLPHVGQLYSIIMIWGTFIVISKYKFLKIPERFVFEEVMHDMLDLTILINDTGKIIRVNKHTLTMLGYHQACLLGQSVNLLLPAIDLGHLLINSSPDKVRFSNTTLQAKNGEIIPVNVSCTPIIDRHIKDLLGALLVIQDLRLVNELLSKNQELHEKSIRDSLTNLYNHQYIISQLENEIDGAFDSGKHLALMMLDIDNFKMVNDIYGHQFGDSVLVIVAKILTDIVQTSGYVGRYGGEEFTIILPQTSIEEASILGNRICTDVKNYGFPNNCCITISIGIKLLDEENATTLIKNADQLLYLAKANGRNRVELS